MLFGTLLFVFIDILPFSEINFTFLSCSGELHIRPSAEIYARANGEGIDSVYADYSQVDFCL